MSKLTKALTAAAGNAGGDNLYVEDVFSTYLYEGDGTNPHTITNGVNLADEGGLVWTKARDSSSIDNVLVDTERGTGWLVSNGSQAASGVGTAYLSFNENGYDIDNAFNNWNGSTIGDYVSWTFRKAEKFFDVVTYSSDTTSGARTISHNLGSTPAFIIVKGLNFSDSWYVYHISTGVNKYLELNLTGAGHASTNFWGVTDSTFTVDSFLNNNGLTGKDYVAYLFASDAGGFGDDGSESIIKCGSYTGNGSTQEINVGFEPQWLLVKRATGTSRWFLIDSMRGFFKPPAVLEANSSAAEQPNITDGFSPTATGFKVEEGWGEINASGNDYIYIAIRRPMKTPESGTEVFAIDTLGGTAPNPPGFNGLLVDWAWKRVRNTLDDWYSQSRLTGTSELALNVTDSESTADTNIKFDYQDGWLNSSSTLSTQLSWMFKRATGFFDVVAYSGDGGTGTQAHNLGVAPELMIFKRRNAPYGGAWNTYVASSVLASAGPTKFLELNDTASIATDNNFINGAPTSSLINTGSNTNQNGDSYIAYLFATLAGVSKVGSYTGTGSNVDVDCGFSAGARFVLIKRTDSTGAWYTWNYFRGITAGNDPYLLLNSTASEVTSTDYIDPLSSGFTVTSSAPAALNASGGTYIFMAIS